MGEDLGSCLQLRIIINRDEEGAEEDEKKKKEPGPSWRHWFIMTVLWAPPQTHQQMAADLNVLCQQSVV